MTLTDQPARLGPDQGRWRQVEGGWELRFERRLRHAPERVWRALTTPEGLACWLAEADIQATPGGRMDLHFRQPDHPLSPDIPERRRQSNQVLTAEPFTRFEHTFGGESAAIVSWRLAPDGDGTHLTLVHRVPDAWAASRSKVLAGWHAHMEGLDDAVQGVRHPWDWDHWIALRDAYEAEVQGAEA
jgi:uncharacterized protein YndB with AHSA1/START domain